MRDRIPRPLPAGAVLSPLDAADAAFRLLAAGPRPLALNPGALAPGLPRRQAGLAPLRESPPVPPFPRECPCFGAHPRSEPAQTRASPCRPAGRSHLRSARGRTTQLLGS